MSFFYIEDEVNYDSAEADVVGKGLRRNLFHSFNTKFLQRGSNGMRIRFAAFEETQPYHHRHYLIEYI